MPAGTGSGIPRKYSPPYPNLQLYGGSGAMSGIPWAEVSTFDLSAGEDGCTLGMTIMVYWQDLSIALQAILGYSYCSSSFPKKILRYLPWQNPKYAQLWAHSVARVEGRRAEGFSVGQPGVIQDGPGAGSTVDIGPSSDYNLALITIKFWRPPYSIRTSSDITNGGVVQEWLRYCDRAWTIQSQMLTRESGYLNWSQADGTGGSTPATWPTSNQAQVPSPIGLLVSHSRISRRWYQIPEAALFQQAQDTTPTGLPWNLLYTQTATTNPITGLTYPINSPIVGCVNSPIGGDPWNGQAHVAANLDKKAGQTGNSNANQFMGFPMGTLRYEGAEIIPRALQLPASLMQIPIIANNEALSQQQYDVIFHFDYYDPPPGQNSGGTYNYFKGHNNGIWAYDNRAYPITTQGNVGNTAKPQTPHNYADFSDLFTPLTTPVATN